ncbi:hypothetical protein ACMX8W_06560 [Bacillus subtilis]|uniref:hypothetical protein n=1 Tax=Bacillus TaxID=1386 RepID=UPI00063FEC4C|nr:hypothetical protein [Bacillus subtilis]AKI91636.1 hypothetical protein ABA10_06550 [Bacillus subtilis]MBE1869506.1 hypothetical protein [Bacillus subtilis]MDX6157159.1 hypothetical protein [Bacillus subtilis]NUC08702.1 hypothetical protein [Bacillus subtilis]UQZ42036.1 hypothetical protein C2H91_03760 [Bacillus subtilis]
MVKVILSFVYLLGFIFLSRWSFDGFFHQDYFSIVGLLWSIIVTFFFGIYTGSPLLFNKITQSKRLTVKNKKAFYVLSGAAVIFFVFYFIFSKSLINEIAPYTVLSGYILTWVSGITLTKLLKPETDGNAQKT